MNERMGDEINPGLKKPRSDNLFHLGEFRTLWAAYAQSILGDQLARVALSLLVFERTDSPGWTAATYALTTLPALLSGVLLSGLADRFPRRTVMISCDLVRMVMVGLMALPGMPLPLLAGLLVLAQLAEAPFGAAQGALLPTVLGTQKYERGQRVMQITHQVGQLVGFMRRRSAGRVAGQQPLPGRERGDLPSLGDLDQDRREGPSLGECRRPQDAARRTGRGRGRADLVGPQAPVAAGAGVARGLRRPAGGLAAPFADE